MSNRRAERDLSASWDSEPEQDGPLDSFASSEEETHVTQYRQLLQQQAPTTTLQCPRYEEDDEEEGRDLACKFCTTNLACPRCAEAKRKRKQQQEQQERSAYMAPKFTLSSEKTVLFNDMLRTESPVPGRVAVSPTATTTTTTLAQPAQTAPPTTAPKRKLPDLRYLTATEMEKLALQASQSPAPKLAEKAPPQSKSTTPLQANPKRTLPDLNFYKDMAPSSAKTANNPNAPAPPLLDVSAGLKMSATPQKPSTPQVTLANSAPSDPLRYTSRTLPELGPRTQSSSINLDSERIDRLTQQMLLAQQASGLGMQAMLMGQRPTTLDCHTGGMTAGETLRNVKCHLRSCH